MIIIGFQGIGKSTLASPFSNFIDLESGNFWIDGKRSEDWYKIYGNIALNLSEQGFDVFTSSHEVLRKYLFENNVNNDLICVCYPDISLKNEWIDKLKRRYELTCLTKDFKAWKNAEDRFEENIKEIKRDKGSYEFEEIVIKSINYDLSDEIKKALRFKR